MHGGQQFELPTRRDSVSRPVSVALLGWALILVGVACTGCKWWPGVPKPVDTSEPAPFRQDVAPVPFRSQTSTSARTSRPKAGLSDESQAIEKSLG
ncbi:MAG: hypothetical protein QM811_04455, partial [Pirellulales bacterium]